VSKSLPLGDVYARLVNAAPFNLRAWLDVHGYAVMQRINAAMPVPRGSKKSGGTFQQACRRCAGEGRLPYSYMSGVCFACGGSGVEEVATDPTVLAARRAKAAAKREALNAEIARRAQGTTEEREARYANDPRIGPQTRARIEQFPAVGYEVYRHLEKIDAGANLPWLLRDYAR